MFAKVYIQKNKIVFVHFYFFIQFLYLKEPFLEVDVYYDVKYYFITKA